MAEVDIIDLWNKGKGQSSEPFDEYIDEISRKKSKTPLYWIKVILWIEFWINVVSLPICIYYRSIDPILYGVIMPIVITPYLFYYQFLIRKINQFDYTQNVRAGLKKLYGYLNFFFLHYKVMIWFSLLLGSVYSIVIGIRQNDIPPEAVEQGGKFWLIVGGLVLLMVGIVGLIFNFIINLIYGRKIKRLKGIVKELEQEEVA